MEGNSGLESYALGTVVWVKLPQFSWWPSEVCSSQTYRFITLGIWGYESVILYCSITRSILQVVDKVTIEERVTELQIKTYGDDEG